MAHTAWIKLHPQTFKLYFASCSGDTNWIKCSHNFHRLSCKCVVRCNTPADKTWYHYVFNQRRLSFSTTNPSSYEYINIHRLSPITVTDVDGRSSHLLVFVAQVTYTYEWGGCAISYSQENAVRRKLPWLRRTRTEAQVSFVSNLQKQTVRELFVA